jgi:hypothetical protein
MEGAGYPPNVSFYAVEEPVDGGVVALRHNRCLAKLSLLSSNNIVRRETPRDLLKTLADTLAK